MEKEYSQKYLQINRSKGVVFDSSEAPFTTVKPDLSDLGQSSSLAERLRDKFPMLNFSQACIVDGAVVIQDVSALKSATEKAKLLNNASDITLQVIDAKSASGDLLELLAPYQAMLDNSLVIFPGEGARTMYNFMEFQVEANAIFLPTKRTMIKTGEFDLSVDYTSLPARINTPRVIIFDDVVASGQTATTIAKHLRSIYPNITDCMVATWIMVEPKSDALSGLKDINRVFASMVVKGNYVKQPPINSISCFMRNGSTYESVKRKFIDKYIRNPNLFRRTLIELGGNNL
jgi:phosphoribosylpyrophosphate synthetase